MYERCLCAIAASMLALCLASPGFAEEAEKSEGGAHTPAADHDHGADKHAKHDGGHGHAEIGAVGVSTDPSEFQTDLAIFTFIVFLVLLGVLWKFAWGPISAALDKREAAIRDDIAAAEQARLKAEQMLEEHAAKLSKVQDEVREIIAEARRDAEHTKQEIISEAQKEADATKRRSVAEIERARDAALKDVFDAMATQVARATEHVLNRSLTGDDQNRLIEEALAEFSKN